MERIWLTYRSKKWTYENGFKNDHQINDLKNSFRNNDELSIEERASEGEMDLILVGDEKNLSEVINLIIDKKIDNLFVRGTYGLKKSSKKGFMLLKRILNEKGGNIPDEWFTRLVFLLLNFITVGMFGEEHLIQMPKTKTRKRKKFADSVAQ